jgi:PAS domain S-box-containing protein
MDITERKKKEEKIRLQSEIIENMLEGVNLINLDDGTIVLTNPAFDEMFGYNPGEMIGKNVAIINAPTEKTPEETREEIMGILKDAGEWHGEVLNVKKDGTPFWCYSNVSLFDHPEYETVCVSVYTDITERKKIEQELKESEEEFRMLFNAANDAIFIVDLECNIIECNKTSNERLGYTRDELLNMTPMDLDTPEYAESVLDRIEIVRQKGESFYEVEHLRKDGKILPVEINSKLINFQGKTAILSIVRDITERKKIEQELKEYEYKLSERVKELTCLYGLSKLVENPVISLRDIINGTLSLIPPALQFPDISTARIIYDSREYKLENFEETAWKLSTRVKINEKPVLIEAYYLEDKLFLKEEHDLIRDIGVRLKTTLEEKEAQNKLRISEEKYRMGFESSTDGIASADMEGTFLDFNNAFLEMLGYSREELLKLNFREITPRRWHEMEDNMIISQLADGKDSGIYEKEYIRKDSTFFPVEVRFWIIKDEQGDPVRMWEIVRDITERKKAEEEITNLAKFPSESPYPVLRVNRNRVIYINDSGKHLLNLKDNDEIPKFLQKEINEAFESNSITESEVEVKNRFYSFTTTPPLEKGYVNIYGMDITEKKQVEQKLKEINKLKSEFLRRASHELKTPLISIKGFSDLILALHKDQINPDVISKLNEINRGCERLQNIINNLLATSRLESPDIKPKVQREDLTFLIKYCVHELQSLAQTRNQIINLDIFDGQYALFEKEEIHDVISNLLTNAIKYTPPNGRIDLRTEIKNGLIIISIKDDGIGFTEDEKSKIFKQFGKIERYGQGLDLGIDGTGLGLYISKRIVESHGGTIWMDSEGKNKGSTFCFSLPLK